MRGNLTSLSRAAALSVAVMMLASPAAAQAQAPAAIPPASTETQPGSLATPAFARRVVGKTVRITKTDGFYRKVVVQSTSPTGMTITFDDSSVSLPFDQIARVEEVPHRLRTGAVIGLATGAGVGALLAVSCGDECQAGESVAFVAVYSAVTAGVGVGIGALVNVIKPNGKIIYDTKPRTTTAVLAPIISPKRKGLAFTMTWR